MNEEDFINSISDSIMNPKKEEEAPNTEETPVDVKTEEDGEGEEKLEREVTPEAKAEDEASKDEEAKDELPTKEISPEDFNDLLASQFEAFGINNADELTAKLADYEAKVKEVEDLKKKVDATPAFKNEGQKKLYEFVSEYDENNVRGFEDFVRLKTLDVASLDEKSSLRELYMFENKHLNREEGIARFNREYKKKYELDDEDLVFLPGDAKVAKEKLAKLQASTKAEVKPEAEAPKANLDFEKGKTEALKALETATKLNEVVVETSQGKFNYELYPEEQKAVKEAISVFLNNPANYDASGKLAQSVETVKEMAIQVLYGKEIGKALYNQGLKDGKIGHVKKISGQEATKTSSVTPLAPKAKSIEDAIANSIMGKK